MAITRGQAHRYIKRHFTPEQAKEYISEAEHGEGVNYWKNTFETLAELSADVVLYFQSKEQS